jgi:ethanolamine utilization protein EutN
VRIAEVIGTVTLSRPHPSLKGQRLVIGVPYSLQALSKAGRGDGEDLVILDPMGAGLGSLIAFSEGGEASAPFYPDKKPIDAYAACILDQVQIKNG